MDNRRRIAIMACQTCAGIHKTLLPELQLRFGHSIYVLPVPCPGNLKPLTFISLLRQGWGGLVVICPKESCCCPQKLKSVMRREILKSILPVFGIYKEKLEIVTATPFEVHKVRDVILKMREYIALEAKERLMLAEFDEVDLKKDIVNAEKNPLIH